MTKIVFLSVKELYVELDTGVGARVVYQCGELDCTRCVILFFLIRIVGSGVHAGSTRHVGH
jgi:hypothetical protein